MGNLTTLTIYNDGIDLIRTHAQEFADAVYAASNAVSGPTTIGLGNFCNLIKVQPVRHADNMTTYVHAGNTVCEMSPYSSDTRRIMREHPVFFEKMLKLMRIYVKDLSEEFKKSQEATSSP
jgi:hypothetical protein